MMNEWNEIEMRIEKERLAFGIIGCTKIRMSPARRETESFGDTTNLYVAAVHHQSHGHCHARRSAFLTT